MNELATEEMQSSNEPIGQEASGCPLQTMHTQRTVPDDELVFPTHPLELGYLELARSFALVGLRSSVQRIRPTWGWPINVRWARIY